MHEVRFARSGVFCVVIRCIPVASIHRNGIELMEEQGHNQRLLRAALVCFALLAIWQFAFPPKRPLKKQAVVTEGTDTSTAGTSLTATSSEGTVTTVAASPNDVDPELFEFAGAVQLSDESGPPTPFRLSLTNVGGGIESFVLPSYKARDVDNAPTDHPISLSEPSQNASDLAAQMAGIEFGEGTTFTVPAKPVYRVVEKSEDGIRYLYRTSEGVEIEREYKLKKDSFAIELAVTVRNATSQPQTHRLAINAAQRLTPVMEGGGMLFMPPPDHLNGACYTDGSVERAPHEDLVKESATFSEGVQWVGMDRQYFLAAIAKRDDGDAECVLRGKDKLAVASLVLPAATLPPGGERRHKFTAYLGVKRPELLTLVDAELESAVDYTIVGLDLAILCQALLAILGLFHKLTGSWGLAILGLTVLVKLTLFPLNQRSGKSMRKMAALKPEIDALKEKFPDDRQRQSEEMMKLYRQHSVNPASGCVPMLIQMPIWFSLYRALWVSVDLYQQSFMWIPDLTAQDPMWILPVALVVVMFIQQKMTPSTMDAMQQKMMQFVMPLMFGFMMAALPAGLCFYIFVNTVLTIVQQHFINRSVGPIGGASSAQGAAA